MYNNFSDFFINLNDLHAADVIEELTEETTRFPDPYDRSQMSSFSRTFVKFFGDTSLREYNLGLGAGGQGWMHISCNGLFRNWLVSLLKAHGITYEEV